MEKLMNFYAKKIIFYTAAPILISLNLQGNSLAMEKEKFGEINTKSFNSSERMNNTSTWGGWFMDLISSVKPAKTMEEALHDPKFYQLTYADDVSYIIEQVRNSAINTKELKESLTDLEGIVGIGALISPYHHLTQLESLSRKPGFNQHQDLLKELQDEFTTNFQLQKPDFIKNSFFRDAIEIFQDFSQQKNRESKHQLASLLNFYGKVQNPIDYVESINGVYNLSQNNQEAFNLSDNHLEFIGQLIKKQWETYQTTPNLQQKIDAALLSRKVAEEARRQEEVDLFLESVDQYNKPLLAKLASGVFGAMEYAVKHPGEAITIMLASQVAAAAALSTPVLGTQFKINQNSLSSGTRFDTAGLANGNVVAAWPDNSNNIIARIFNGTTPVTNEFFVTTSALSSQITPQVAGLTGGNFFVTWQGSNTILSRIFYPNGTAVTNPFTTNQVTTYANIAAPQVAGLSGGNAIVGWGGSSAGDYNIPARIFSPKGAAITNEFKIAGPTTALLGDLSLTGLSNGDALATYSTSGLFGVTVSPTGTVGSPFAVNQSAFASTSGEAPQVAGLSGGNAVVAYQQGSTNIFGRIIQNGAPLGNEFSAPNGGSQVNAPTVAGLTDDTALVVYSATNVTSLSTETYGALFSSTGAALTSQFTIPAASNGNFPNVVGLANGGAFVSWFDNFALYGRTVTFSSTLTPTPTPSGGTPTPTPSGGTPTPTPSGGTPTPTPSGTPTPTPTSAANAQSPSLWATLGATALYVLMNKLGYE
jgi:hypothetical protein